MCADGPPCFLMTTYQLVKLRVPALKKAVRKAVESWNFWNRDVVEIGMVDVWVMFRLDFLLASSRKCQVSLP